MTQVTITKLDKWHVSQFGIANRHRLSGVVTGHPHQRWVPDGASCTTTHLIAYNPETKVATTSSGTRYHLETPYNEPGQNYLEILAKLNLPKEADYAAP